MRKITLTTITLLLITALLVPQASQALTVSDIWENLANFSFTWPTTSTEPAVAPELPMKDWVLQRVIEAGLNPTEAEIIITCESRWNPDAMGINQNHTADLGLWQINSIHKDITNSDKLDYKKATDWAIAKRLKDGHWRAWTCSRKLAKR